MFGFYMWRDFPIVSLLFRCTSFYHTISYNIFVDAATILGVKWLIFERNVWPTVDQKDGFCCGRSWSRVIGDQKSKATVCRQSIFMGSKLTRSHWIEENWWMVNREASFNLLFDESLLFLKRKFWVTGHVAHCMKCYWKICMYEEAVVFSMHTFKN